MLYEVYAEECEEDEDGSERVKDYQVNKGRILSNAV